MPIDYLRLASFLVALTAALGAIPLARQLQTRIGAQDPERALPGVGGYALVLGLFIATFYVSILPKVAVGLGQATIIALLLAALDYVAATTWQLSSSLRATLRAAVILIVTTTLLAPAAADMSQPAMWLLLAALTALPLALARIGVVTERVAPCRTAYLFYLMVIGLLIVSDHAALLAEPGPPAIKPILNVLTPLLGALLACLYYMTDTPWRRGSIAMGHGGHFILGFALSWAALLIASTNARPAATAATLILIVGSPIYSALARWMLAKLGKRPAKPTDQATNQFFGRRRALFDYISTTTLVGIGLFLMFAGAHWALALLTIPLTFALYALALAVVERRISQSRVSFGLATSVEEQPVGRS